MTGPGRGLPALGFTLLIAVTAAAAGEREHAVRAGESASAIARDYYGDVKLGELLLRYNGRSDTTLRVGERLRIPYCERHVVGRGDTWSGLAHRYLGDGSLHPVLARLNGQEPGASLHPRQAIVIPVLLPHTLRRGESLGSLAERYSSRSDVLRELNGVEDPRRLSVGQRLRIPILSFWLREDVPEPRQVASIQPVAAKPVASTGPPVDLPSSGPEPPPRSFAGPLRAAGAAIQEGEYRQARRELEALAPEVQDRGSDEDRTELARLLAIVYIAFDLPDRACEAFAAAAGVELDPDLVSPKIRNTLAGCSG